jgi:hypothetical protein
MTGVDRLASTASIAPAATQSGDARSLAAATIGEIGHRVLAWVGAAGGAQAAGSGAWSQVAGESSGFRPDQAELARGGDIYDLNGLSRAIAGETGATPTQEGELRRALEDFTRAAVVQVAGLSGATGERQTGGIQVALQAATGGGSPAGSDGVVERIERATASLTATNGG